MHIGKRLKIKFKEVDEIITWQMEFPSGAIANCTTSFAWSRSSKTLF